MTFPWAHTIHSLFPESISFSSRGMEEKDSLGAGGWGKYRKEMHKT